MATKIQLIECVICSEYLSDPRALPCGHSFCGPPRLCLSSMGNAKGGICCAICRTDHNLKAEDIKPLYGIRDFIQGISESQSTERQRLLCSNHPTNDCSLWCIKCEVMICVDCVGDLHDGHSVRKLRSHMLEKLEVRFGNFLRDGMKDYSDVLETDIVDKKCELEKLKDQLHALETGFVLAQQRKQLVDNVFNALRTETENETSMDETSFVVKLLKIDCLHVKFVSRNDAELSSRSDYEKTPSARVERTNEADFSSVASYSEGHSVSTAEDCSNVDVSPGSRIPLLNEKLQAARSKEFQGPKSESASSGRPTAQKNLTIFPSPAITTTLSSKTGETKLQKDDNNYTGGEDHVYSNTNLINSSLGTRPKVPPAPDDEPPHSFNSQEDEDDVVSSTTDEDSSMAGGAAIAGVAPGLAARAGDRGDYDVDEMDANELRSVPVPNPRIATAPPHNVNNTVNKQRQHSDEDEEESSAADDHGHRVMTSAKTVVTSSSSIRTTTQVVTNSNSRDKMQQQQTLPSTRLTGTTEMDRSKARLYPGIPVRAVYNYEADEMDEISLEEGDELIKLSEADENGWSYGLLRNRYGHYPASFVEPL